MKNPETKGYPPLTAFISTIILLLLASGLAGLSYNAWTTSNERANKLWRITHYAGDGSVIGVYEQRGMPRVGSQVTLSNDTIINGTYRIEVIEESDSENGNRSN